MASEVGRPHEATGIVGREGGGDKHQTEALWPCRHPCMGHLTSMPMLQRTYLRFMTLIL